MADRFGNVWIGRRRELAAMAYASRIALVTVERIVEENLLADEMSAAGVLPALYVTAVAPPRRGVALWPVGRVSDRQRGDRTLRESRADGRRLLRLYGPGADGARVMAEVLLAKC